MANPTPAVAPTDEQRIAAERITNLETQASEAAAETQKARGDAAAFKGELERANVELAGLRASNQRLNELLAASSAAAAKSDSLPALPIELPKNARQLVESVTFAAVGADGSPVRANGKRGDVVVIGKGEVAEELQGRIGLLIRVYPVSRATADELDQLKHVR
jgi:hypothetical protein